jgi:hypothetical protein
MTLRIAMWSGPRNLSTAMMYAFAARGDCEVVDEPFYAAWLAATGQDHPMRAETLASQPTDPRSVASDLVAPKDKSVFYAKLMTHHMAKGFPLDWTARFAHVFLIRHPARVIASYAKKRERPTLDDIGFAEQASLFDTLAERLDQVPIVIDATRARSDPRASLSALCARLGLAFTETMLHWPAGPKPFDGAWAPHWYGAVHRSSGLDAAEEPLPQLRGEDARLAEAALPHYQRLLGHL